MKKLNFVFFLLVIVLHSAYAQDEKQKDTVWSSGMNSTLNFSQISFTNWAAGGQNSYALSGRLDLFANYTKDNISWENSLELAYGLVNQEGYPTKKSNDIIDFSSKFGYKGGKNWYYTFLLDFKTQFYEGYSYDAGERDRQVSDFMAPGYLVYSAGIDWQPSDHFSAYIAPVTGKNTFVLNNTLAKRGSFGLDSAQNVRSELGGYVKLKYQKEIFKNVNVNTKLDLFSNYLNNPENIDVNWDVGISMDINSYLTANLNTQLIYDDDIDIIKDGEKVGPRIQFKETFGLGLTYNIQN